jgi:hypothetical protein
MKKLTKQILLLSIIGLIISCSKDEPKFAGLGDFSGNFRLYSVNLPNECTNFGIYSPNDLEILRNGRFKRKLYSLNSDNKCIVSEIVEGQITINGTFYGSPFGIVKYDNSEITDQIHIGKSTNGVHNSITISKKGGLQHGYLRTD